MDDNEGVERGGGGKPKHLVTKTYSHVEGRKGVQNLFLKQYIENESVSVWFWGAFFIVFIVFFFRNRVAAFV